MVEDAFDQLLESAVPAKATFELAEKMFRAAWDRKAEQTTEDQQALRTRAKSIERDVEVYLERISGTKVNSVAEAYERKIAELEAEKVRLIEASAKLAPRC